MRDIKFRVWNKTNMKWVGFGVYDGLHEDYVKEHCSEIMQYTGLKDKNGKEIYEGDIISYKDGRVCEITWHEHTASFDSRGLTSNGIPRPLNDRPHILCEVIGNIYENPELLK